MAPFGGRVTPGSAPNLSRAGESISACSGPSPEPGQPAGTELGHPHQASRSQASGRPFPVLPPVSPRTVAAPEGARPPRCWKQEPFPEEPPGAGTWLQWPLRGIPRPHKEAELLGQVPHKRTTGAGTLVQFSSLNNKTPREADKRCRGECGSPSGAGRHLAHGGTRMHGALLKTPARSQNKQQKDPDLVLFYLLAFKGVPLCWLS